MKHRLVLLIIIFCSYTKETNGKKENWNHEADLNLVGLQEDDKEGIYRPCDFLDLKCIREFIAKNSHCSVKTGPAPDPLILKRSTVNFPLVNITVILDRMQISGLNDAKVTEFYVNENTGNVVFAIDVKGMSERSSSASFRYLRTGKEPIVLTDYVTLTFNRITYTAVIPKVPHLQLHKADIHADIADSNPALVIGPKAYNSSDPAVQRSFAALTASMPRFLREALLLKTSLNSSNILDVIKDFEKQCH